MTEPSLAELELRFQLPDLSRLVDAAISRSAEPGRATRLSCQLLEAVAEREDFTAAWKQRPIQVARILAALGGSAPFLIPLLVRNPDWLARLAREDLTEPRTSTDYSTRVSELLTPSTFEQAGSLLRRFKYYELTRITVRDLSDDLVGEAHSGQILAELSRLADALLSEALSAAAALTQERFGPPAWQHPDGSEVRLGFCVLGLGKLGSEELNYSSDVDLVYVYESPSSESEASLRNGPGDLSPAEYFARLARAFGGLVSESTSDGFLYRIDLDLRPEGSRGPLVVSADALASYYDGWSATWEKAAFMKARPVAGELALGWRIIRATDPMIFRSSMDFTAVEAIKQMKGQIQQARDRKSSTFNVKIGSGGIREIEFVAQALQLLHGGRMPQVRGRSTQQALVALAQVGTLPEREYADLLSGYRFLRRIENRLQMEAERQLHRLPADSSSMERLARSMGYFGREATADFAAALEKHRSRIHEIFTALFSEGATERVLRLFDRNAPGLLGNRTTREMTQELARLFARAIDATPSPEHAINNLDRFLQGVANRRFFYELLFDRPELIPRLAALFSDSEFLSGYLSAHPRLIEPIFNDPHVLLLSQDDLRTNLQQIQRDLGGEGERSDVELSLDSLRRFHNRQLINVGLLDLSGKITPSEAEAGLTDIAEICIEAGLVLAREEMERRGIKASEAAPHGEFLVIGMGKLASRELTYGSDLDVIFLYDVPGANEETHLGAQEYYVRLAQKLIWSLQTRTSAGVCYQIDARLRPSGGQGMLVTSLDSFSNYHISAAKVWERQALLRARPVAGGERLAGAFEKLRHRILTQPLSSDLGSEIHRIRLRMESEMAQETTSRRDLKIGRGGLLDVESVVQFLQLQHGVKHEALLQVDSIQGHIERLRALHLLSEGNANTLRDGWEFLQLLSSRLRIVENRSISDLDEERGDLDALALRLGYTAPQRAGGARRALLDDYRRHTEAIRDVYLQALDVPDTGG